MAITDTTEAQRRWDAYAERFGIRAALRRFGPRPRLSDREVEEATATRGIGGTLKDVALGLGAGIGEAAVGIPEGLAGLAGAIIPGSDPAERAAERLDEAQERFLDPETGAGRVAKGVGRVGAEVASALLPGALLGKVGKIGALGRLGVDAAADAVIEAGVDPEESLASALTLEKTSQSRVGRAAVGALASGILAAPFEGSRAVRRLRAAREAELEEAAKEARQLRVSNLRPHRGAADSDVILPHQATRQVEIAEEAKRAGELDPKRAPAQQAVPGFEDPQVIARQMDEVTSTISRLDNELAGTPPGTPRHRFLEQEVEQTERLYASLLSDYAGGVSEGGRRLAQHKFRVQAERSVTGLHQYVTRQLGGSVTPGQLAELDAFITKGVGGRLEAVDSVAVAKWLEEQKNPLSWGDWGFYTTLIRSGMLSAIYSPLRSFAGNLTSAGTMTVGAPVRSASDAALSYIVRRFSGREDIGRTFVLSGDALKSAFSRAGLSRDIAAAASTMRHGFDKLDLLDRRQALEKLELAGRRLESGLTIAGRDIADKLGKIPFHAQGAADIPFRRAAARVSIAQQAVEIASRMEKLDPALGVKALKREGLSEAQAANILGQAYKDRVQHLIANPTMGMEMRAIEEAAFLAFQTDTKIASAINRFKRFGESAGGQAARGLSDLIFPFVRTPSAIAARTLEASPIGWINDIVDFVGLVRGARATRGGRDEAIAALKKTQNQLARRLGDQAVAFPFWAAFLVGRDLKLDGLVTGGLPRDPQEREQFFREGKVPYAVNVNDRWWSLSQLPPFGHVVAMGAALAEHKQQTEEAIRRGEETEPFSMMSVDAAIRAGRVGVDVVAETPFAQGVGRISDLLGEGGGIASGTRTAVANTVASVVPNLAASVARADDPIREKRRDTFPNIIRDFLVERTPGINRELPVRRDRTLGTEVRRERSTAGRIGSLVDPFGSSPDRTLDDAAIAELARIGAQPSPPRKLAGEDQFDFAERLGEEGPQVRSAILAFIGAEGDGTPLLRRAGVSAALQREYQALQGLPQTQEVVQAQEEILMSVISAVRRLQGRRRSRVREGTTAGG